MCVRARARERVRVRVSACAYVCMCVCVYVYIYMYMYDRYHGWMGGFVTFPRYPWTWPLKLNNMAILLTFSGKKSNNFLGV